MQELEDEYILANVTARHVKCRDRVQGVGENTSLNQNDSVKEGGFRAMLGGFHAASVGVASAGFSR